MGTGGVVRNGPLSMAKKGLSFLLITTQTFNIKLCEVMSLMKVIPKSKHSKNCNVFIIETILMDT